jgi:hypothetical protein
MEFKNKVPLFSPKMIFGIQIVCLLFVVSSSFAKGEKWTLTAGPEISIEALGVEAINKVGESKTAEEKRVQVLIEFEINALLNCQKSRPELKIGTVKYGLAPDETRSHNHVPIVHFRWIECHERDESSEENPDVISAILSDYSKKLKDSKTENPDCISKPSAPSLNTVHSDILSVISKYLDAESLAKLGQTSKKFHEFVKRIPKNMVVDFSRRNISDEKFDKLFGPNGMFHNAAHINLENATINLRKLANLPNTMESIKGLGSAFHLGLPLEPNWLEQAFDPNRFPRLTEINLSERFAPKYIPFLAKFSNLEKIGLNSLRQMKNQEVVQIANDLPKLKQSYIDLGFVTSFKEEAGDEKILFPHVLAQNKMTNLEEVYIFAKSLTSENAGQLPERPSVRKLILETSSFEAGAFEKIISAYPNLEEITLKGARLQADIPEALSKLKNLKKLRLNTLNASQGIAFFSNVGAHLSNLESLTYNIGTGTQDTLPRSFIPGLSKMKNLRSLKVGPKAMTLSTEDLEGICDTKLPQLRELSLSLNNHVSYETFRELSKLPELKAVNHCWTVTQKSFERHAKQFQEEFKHMKFNTRCSESSD